MFTVRVRRNVPRHYSSLHHNAACIYIYTIFVIFTQALLAILHTKTKDIFYLFNQNMNSYKCANNSWFSKHLGGIVVPF